MQYMHIQFNIVLDPNLAAKLGIQSIQALGIEKYNN